MRLTEGRRRKAALIQRRWWVFFFLREKKRPKLDVVPLKGSPTPPRKSVDEAYMKKYLPGYQLLSLELLNLQNCQINLYSL